MSNQTTTTRDAAHAAPQPSAPAPDALRDALADPLASSTTSAAATTSAPPATTTSAPPEGPLPPVPLPSRFRPEAFKQASQARGARPASLREIDALLGKVDGTPDPQVRFNTLLELQSAVDQFVRGYGRDNARGKATWDLKEWVDGAVTLRARQFKAPK